MLKYIWFCLKKGICIDNYILGRRKISGTQHNIIIFFMRNKQINEQVLYYAKFSHVRVERTFRDYIIFQNDFPQKMKNIFQIAYLLLL